MKKATRIIVTGVYYLSWLFIVTTLSVLVLCVPFAIIPDLGLDDDLTYLVGVPLGCALAIPVGWKLRPFRSFHYFSASVGLIGAVSFLILAVRCLSQAQSLKGVAGPFSGLGHAIYGYLAVIGALFCISLIVEGITGVLIRGTTSSTAEPSSDVPCDAD
jgi:hypothetical protein